MAAAPALFAQTIQVVDSSGKIVNSSNHLVDLFREAKRAYRQKKDEILGVPLSARPPPSRPITVQGENPAKPPRSPRHAGTSTATSRRQSTHDVRSPTYTRHGLPRRYSTAGIPSSSSTVLMPPRTDENIDMALAYGELPWDLRQREQDLPVLVNRVTTVLEEMHCLQASASTIISHLKQRPEALAAIGLTLAEISNILTKVAPGTLASLRVSAPAVMALLASPQFMIAAGVGVGLVIVSLGGFKIIRKLVRVQSQEPARLVQIPIPSKEYTGIESWRRGVADQDAASVAPSVSVDGEYITPLAASMSRLNVDQEPGPTTPTRLSRSSTAVASRVDTIPSPRREERQSSDRASRHSGSKSETRSGGSGRRRRRVLKVKPRPSPLKSFFNIF